MVHSIINSNKHGCYDNVAQVLLHPGLSLDEQIGEGEEVEEEGLTEQEKEEKRVVKALEMKYDALRDKLIVEVTYFLLFDMLCVHDFLLFVFGKRAEERGDWGKGRGRGTQSDEIVRPYLTNFKSHLLFVWMIQNMKQQKPAYLRETKIERERMESRGWKQKKQFNMLRFESRNSV